MITLLTILLYLSGFIFILAVMLLAPKWWIGFGIGGAAGSNEYGSKKSIEGTIKKIAFISIAIFLVVVIVYPYVNNKNSNSISNTKVLDNIKSNWENITVDSIWSGNSQ